MLALGHGARRNGDVDGASRNRPDATAAPEARQNRDVRIRIAGGEFVRQQPHRAKTGAASPDLDVLGSSHDGGCEHKHKRDEARTPSPRRVTAHFHCE